MATKKVQDIIETHRATMIKAPSFKVWARRHLRTENAANFEKAYIEIHKVCNEADIEPGSGDYYSN